MNANDKLTAKIAAQSVDQLKEISLRLTLDCSVEAIIVCNRVERELAARLPEAEFVAHMEACEALLDVAMAA
jgi:hypothetical protein